MHQIDENNPNFIERVLIWIQKQDQFTLFLLITMILALIIEPSLTSNTPTKPLPRKDFSQSTKKSTLSYQGFVCNSCKNPSKYWDFHHRDWNRSNNSSSNCEALCPACHAKKTRNRFKK